MSKLLPVRREEEPVLIVGSGALAGLFGARLSVAGVPVILLGSWVDGVRAIQENGIRLVEEDGRLVAVPVRAVREAQGLGPIRQALVLRKSWQTPRAARELSQCLAPDGVALTLQNGFGNLEALAGVLGPSRAAVGVTTTPARVLSPGVVAVTGTGTITVENRPRLRPLVRVLRRAGFTVETGSELAGLLWGKLVVSAAINPLTALLRVRNGHLLGDPTVQNLAFRAGDETAAVAEQLGVRLPYDDPHEAIRTVLRHTADNHSSMLQDVLRGAPTEIDAICGAIVRQGAQVGVATPLNQSLYHLIQTSLTIRRRSAVSAG